MRGKEREDVLIYDVFSEGERVCACVYVLICSVVCSVNNLSAFIKSWCE